MSGVACEGTRGARGAAFSAVPLADIKSALRWNTLAFGEQPSCPHHLRPHGFSHHSDCCSFIFGIVANKTKQMIRYLFMGNECNASICIFYYVKVVGLVICILVKVVQLYASVRLENTRKSIIRFSRYSSTRWPLHALFLDAIFGVPVLVFSL